MLRFPASVLQIIGIDILSSTRQPNGVLIPVKLNDIGDREGKNGQSVQEIINKVAALGADARKPRCAPSTWLSCRA